MHEQLYKTSSVTLNYFEGPKNGPALLLVHGNMERWQAFLPVIDELMQDYHVFALDLRGHGKSSHATGSYSLDTYMQDIVEFIKLKINGPVIYFGFSLGGMIGIMLAAQHPDLISKLIIGDSPLTLETLEPMIASQSDIGQTMISYLKAGQYDEMLAVFKDQAFCESISACDIDIIESTFFRFNEILGGFDIGVLLPKIQCPVLVLHGEQQLGSMITDKDLRLSQALLPAMQVRKTSGVGHAILMRKEIVLESVKQFLVCSTV